jgi:hypothetical protein
MKLKIQKFSSMQKQKFLTGLLLLFCSIIFVKAAPRTSREVQPGDKIAAARYAPEGMYMKDHYMVFHQGKWHLFAPLGPVGTMWHYEGSEESAEHMVSEDLINWEHIGTAVPASRKEDHFDRLMGE